MSKQHVRRGREAKQRRRTVALANLLEQQQELTVAIYTKQQKLNGGKYKEDVAYIRNARKRTAAAEALREDLEYLLAVDQRRASITHREITILQQRVR